VATRRFYTALDARFVPPCSKSINRILLLLLEVQSGKKKNWLQAARALLGKPFLNVELDIWTAKNASESYAAMKGSIILNDENGVLRVHDFVLEFAVFPNNRHTALHIKAWMESVFVDNLLSKEDIIMATPDGAANGKKALKLMGLEFIVCYCHDLQRAMLYALGRAGKTSRNPEVKALIELHHKIVTKVHTSTLLTKDLIDAQVSAGVVKGKAKTVTGSCVTRQWQGDAKILGRNLDLQVYLDSILTQTMLHPTSTQEELLLANDVYSDEEEEFVDPVDEPVPCLTASQWLSTRILFGIIKPAFDATTMLETSSSVSIDRALPLILSLLKHFQSDVIKVPQPGFYAKKVSEWECKKIEAAKIPAHLQLVRTIAAEEIKKRFLSEAPHDWILVGLAMNPSLNLQKLFSYKPELLERSKLALNTAFFKQSVHYNATIGRNKAPKEPQAAVATGGADNVLALDDFSYEAAVATPMEQEVDDSLNAELQAYWRLVGSPDLSKHKENGRFSVLKFWTVYQVLLPILGQVAQKCFSIFASEANVERLFSYAGDVVNDLRTRLQPELVRAWVTVPLNMETFPVDQGEVHEAYVEAYGKCLQSEGTEETH
jgi:hypothetical protein